MIWRSIDDDQVPASGTGANAPISSTGQSAGGSAEPVVGLTILASAGDGDACTDGYCAIPGADAADRRPGDDR